MNYIRYVDHSAFIALMKVILISISLSIGFTANSQSDGVVQPFRNVENQKSQNGIFKIKGDFTMAGNTNLTQLNYREHIGSNSNNLMQYIDIDNDPNTLNSSSAHIEFGPEISDLEHCTEIIYAGLYWTGKADLGPGATNSISTRKTTPFRDSLDIYHDTSIEGTPYELEVRRMGTFNNYYLKYIFRADGERNLEIEFRNSAPYIYYRYSNNNDFHEVPGDKIIDITNDRIDIDFPGLTFWIGKENPVALEVFSLSRPRSFTLNQSEYRQSSTAGISKYGLESEGVERTLFKNELKLKKEGQPYISVSADPENQFIPSDQYGQIYSCSADVTEYVNEHGTGEYFVADMALTEGNGDSIGYFGCWSLIVVYENPSLTWKNIAVFKGHAFNESPNPREMVPATFDLDVEGFEAIQHGPVNVKIGYMAGEGDKHLPNDFFKLQEKNTSNFIPLSHEKNSEDNFFNSSIFTGGNPRNPQLENNTGIDIGLFEIDNSNYQFIENGQTSTTFHLGTVQDLYTVSMIAVGIDAYVPEVEAILTVNKINEIDPESPLQSVRPGQSIEYCVDIINPGTEPIQDLFLNLSLPITSDILQVSIESQWQDGITPNENTPLYNEDTRSITWDFGNLPLSVNRYDTLASFCFKVTATRECSILAIKECLEEITIEGNLSGIGAITTIPINEKPMVNGLTIQESDCDFSTDRSPIKIIIDAIEYVQQNCEGYGDDAFQITVSPDENGFAVTNIEEYFLEGTRFYNEQPRTDSSIEYDLNNPFPAEANTQNTYYGYPIADLNCFIPVRISVTENCGLVLDCGDQPIGLYNCNNPIPPAVTTVQEYIDRFNASIINPPCGSAKIFYSDGPFNPCSSTTLSRTYTIYDDLNSNNELDNNEESITCEKDYTYFPDVEPPTIEALNTIELQGCNTPIPNPDISLIQAEDNCSNVQIEFIKDSLDQNNSDCIEQIIRIYKATDQCENSDTIHQTIRRKADLIPPVITCTSTISLSCGQSTHPDQTGYPQVSDNCDNEITNLSYSDEIQEGSCSETYTVIRTWEAVDSCGNIDSCRQILDVVDTTPPNITCPASTTVFCGESTHPDQTGYPSVSDNCNAEIDVNYRNDTIIDVTCQYTYIIERTWIATDPCGNIDSCVQTINVANRSEIQINCPENYSIDPNNCITQEAVDLEFEEWLDQFSYMGGCTPTVEITNPGPPNKCGGSSTVLWDVIKTCGDTLTCSATFTVAKSPEIQVSCPSNNTVSFNLSQEEIEKQFTAWLNTFSVSGGCNTTVVTNNTETPTKESCMESTKTVTWIIESECSENIVCSATFTISFESNNSLPPNCQSIHPSIDKEGLTVITTEDYLTNHLSADYPLKLTIQNEIGGVELEKTFNSPCEIHVFNACEYLGRELTYSIANDAGICTDGRLLFPDNPPIFIESAWQNSFFQSLNNSGKSGQNISTGKIVVYCGQIPSPDNHIPSVISPCDNNSYQITNEPDWIMPFSCDHNGDTSKIILRTWEVFDKGGNRFTLTDTIVVMKLPKLTPGAFLNQAEDTIHCEINSYLQDSIYSKSYKKWKQPLGLHDYERPYTKLKGVEYYIPEAFMKEGLISASEKKELKEYLQCIILKRGNGKNVTIKDLIDGTYHEDLIKSFTSEQLIYGNLSRIARKEINELSINLDKEYTFYNFLLLSPGDQILSEKGDYEIVSEEWFYYNYTASSYGRDNNSPYWFTGGWPILENDNKCLRYYDQFGDTEHQCIQVQVPALNVNGYDTENCMTICLPNDPHCGITYKNTENSSWTGNCPQTQNSVWEITQTCWSNFSNQCTTDIPNPLVTNYEEKSKQVKITLDQWRTRIDRQPPIFDFCYPLSPDCDEDDPDPIPVRSNHHFEEPCQDLCWDQQEIMDNIKNGEQNYSALLWEQCHPTIYNSDPNSCEATIFVPQVQLIDNCSDIKEVKAYLNGRFVSLEQTDSILTIQNGDSIIIKTFEHTQTPFTLPFNSCEGQLSEVTYIAIDKCWNESNWTKFVTVQDRISPTVVSDDTLNVNLNGQGYTWVKTESLDEGSWDNCGIKDKYGRRNDWHTAKAGVNLCTGREYKDFEEILIDLGLKPAHVINAISNVKVGIDYITIYPDSLFKFLNENEVEIHYYETLVTLLEEETDNNKKVVMGYLYDMAEYLATNCSDRTDPHHNLYPEELQRIFDNLARIDGYGNEMSSLGGGWSHDIPFSCKDVCENTWSDLLIMDYCGNWNTSWIDVKIVDKTLPEVVRKLPDIEISTDAYHDFYKKIIEEAVGNGRSSDSAFQDINEIFGSYQWVQINNTGNPLDEYGQPLPQENFINEYKNIICREKSIIEKTADTLHSGEIVWNENVSKELVFDTLINDQPDGLFITNCSAKIEQDVWIDTDDCGKGIITRRFFLGSGCSTKITNKEIHQVITVNPGCSLRESMFDPPKKDLELCTDKPDNIANISNKIPTRIQLKPHLEEALTHRFYQTYEDAISKVITEPDKYKILRTWEIKDICTDQMVRFEKVYVVWINPDCKTTEIRGSHPIRFDYQEKEISLSQNRPNPFKDHTTIEFYLPDAYEIQLTVFDINGKAIKNHKAQYSRGYHEFTLDKSEFGANGIYYYTLRTREKQITKKMIFIR